MKKIYWGQVIALTFCLFFGGCLPNKEDALTPINVNAINEAISIENGMLRFPSQSIFQKIMTGLQTGDDVSKWSSQFRNFTSLKEHYDDLVKNDIGEVIKSGKLDNYRFAYELVKNNDGKNEYARSVSDNVLASVLNKDGLVLIGEYLYRANNEQITRINIRFKEELFQSTISRNTEVQQVINFPLMPQSKANARIADVDYYDNINYTPWSGASERRFKVNWFAKQYCWLGYIGMGMEVSHQRSNWWGWGAIDANNWAGSSAGVFKATPTENVNLTQNLSASSASSMQLGTRYGSSTCSTNGNRLVNYTKLSITVTGNDGIVRTISHPFNVNI